MSLEKAPRQLWSEILAFNFAPQVDYSYLTAALQPLDAAKVKNRFLLASAAVAAFKDKKLPRFYDFSTPFRCLALLSPPKLWQLILFSGVGIYHEQLRKLIDKARVRKLRRELGSSYDFAINSAPLLAPPPPGEKLPTDPAEFALVGHRLLEAAAVKEPPPLQKLWALRFPKHMGWRAVAADDSSAEGAAAFLVRVSRQL